MHFALTRTECMTFPSQFWFSSLIFFQHLNTKPVDYDQEFISQNKYSFWAVQNKYPRHSYSRTQTKLHIPFVTLARLYFFIYTFPDHDHSFTFSSNIEKISSFKNQSTWCVVKFELQNFTIVKQLGMVWSPSDVEILEKWWRCWLVLSPLLSWDFNGDHNNEN